MDDLLEKHGVFDFGIFGYRAGYILPRSWKLIPEAGREIKWAWQRVFRGWDDRVIWSIDTYLAYYLPVWLEKLKHDKTGIPISAFNNEDFENDGNTKEEAEEPALERWKSYLDEMIVGFKAAQKLQEYDYCDDFEYDNLNHTFQRGMKQFTEHFFDLWD